MYNGITADFFGIRTSQSELQTTSSRFTVQTETDLERDLLRVGGEVASEESLRFDDDSSVAPPCAVMSMSSSVRLRLTGTLISSSPSTFCFFAVRRVDTTGAILRGSASRYDVTCITGVCDSESFEWLFLKTLKLGAPSSEFVKAWPSTSLAEKGPADLDRNIETIFPLLSTFFPLTGSTSSSAVTSMS
ncbi:hypothetical protein RvY_05800-1 [Ramazzottius varieornatus]|uniref:Uncharacterized protein n=1 Tax=Ramazzottius varieornatus TaxID=947166 RepID=A0A1D1UWB8_RAMVA|nr:hypothetical protein RvY_05800-1 [Ramazzottius varieornatus]